MAQSAIVKAFNNSRRYQWYLTATGKARHLAPAGNDNPSMCGIPPERLVTAAPSPTHDGRYHLGCTRCYGNTAKAEEMAGLTKTQRERKR